MPWGLGRTRRLQRIFTAHGCLVAGLGQLLRLRAVVVVQLAQHALVGGAGLAGHQLYVVGGKSREGLCPAHSLPMVEAVVQGHRAQVTQAVVVGQRQQHGGSVGQA